MCQALRQLLNLFAKFLLHIDGKVEHAVAQNAIARRHFVANRLQVTGCCLSLSEQAPVFALTACHNRAEHVLDFLDITLLLALRLKKCLQCFIATRLAASLT